jgi:hypothetical protein
MLPDEFITYQIAADVLQAQEMLRAMNVADYPHMKKQGRDKLHRDVYKRAFPDQKKRVITTEDLKTLLGGVS